MKKLLMLGTSLGSLDIVRTAQALGCHVIVTDYLPPELSLAKRGADEQWMISTGAVDELELRCRKEGVDAVFAGVSEFNLDRVLDLCERLGLPCYFDRNAWEYARNKARFKELCRATGVPVAGEFRLDEGDIVALRAGSLEAPDASLRFPVVVKPVDGCGNRGVSFCHDRTELLEAWQLVREVSDNPRVLVEEYVSGVEYCNVYALADGEASLLCVRTGFKQPGYPTNLYILGATVAEHVEEYVRDINPAVTRMLKEAGCHDGLAWIQTIRDNEGRYSVLEMGHRLSADMVFDKMVTMTGFDAVRWMVECQLGVRHTADQLPQSQEHAFRDCASAYLLFAERAGVVSQIVGVETVANWAGPLTRQEESVSVELLIHPGDAVKQHQLVGKVTFHSVDCDGLCEMVRFINRELRIVDDDGHNMFVRFTDLGRVSATYERSLESW